MPARLPKQAVVEWEFELLRPGLGGIAATEKHIVFGDRDPLDFHDVWRCLDPDAGKQRWEVKTLAVAELDYGNTPRTTPLLAKRLVDGKPVAGGELAFLLGAAGDLLCVRLADGEIIWQRNLAADFGAQGERPWGYCGSPLLVDNKLIVNPGAADASLVALEPATGDVIWKAKGGNVGYGSYIVATLGGKRQIVGYDEKSLGGWDIATGQRLWKLVPPVEGDFNVPTPIELDGRLLVATENNGTRLYTFDEKGVIRPDPVAVNPKLRPNMSSPVVVGNKLYCTDRFLYELDLGDELTERWRLRDPAFGDFAAILADDDRLLVIGNGEVLIVDPASRDIVSRQRLFTETTELFSHAAILGDRLFVRGESALKCVQLKAP